VNRAPAFPSLVRLMAAEFVGTFLLVFFGCGAVHSAVLTGAQQGLWEVAIVWGLAIMVAVYSIGGVSGAHINPAITLAFTLWRRFPISHVGPYIVAQFLGAFVAAGALFVIFGPHLEAKETAKHVIRGEPGSVVTAMCYGEYFPNPGPLASGNEPYSASAHEQLRARMSATLAFIAEVIGTAILGFVVFAVTDMRNPGRPIQTAPVFIGLTVAGLISVIAPLTQACFNPARDFGPRVFAAIAGWGSVALPGFADTGWLTVYIIAPSLGAIVGGGIYDALIRPSFPQVTEELPT